MMDFLQLGASLYVPATRADLAAIGNGVKYPALRSVIFCAEDAVGPRGLPLALDNLEEALRRLEPTLATRAPLLRFVRVPSPAVLRRLLTMDGARHLTGFVLPKFTRHNLDEYFAAFAAGDAYRLMLVLETAEVFDPVEMAALRDRLLNAHGRQRILSLRIGGNDLLQLLGLRRPRRGSIYATPLGPLIGQLVAIFRPHGFNLTGPVCEHLDSRDVLARETRQDLAHGLFGKSAIHPRQVPVIEAQYRVGARDLEAAERVLTDDAPAVFRLHESMCEPATHLAWARQIVQRARLYGVRRQPGRPLVVAPEAC